MKKTQYTAAELNEITAIQEERSITRKSAIRIFEKGNRRIILTVANKKAAPVVSAPTPNPMPITVAAQADPAMTALPDVKMRAANDDSASVETAKAAPAPKPPTPPTPAGDARKEGIRLFQLAGKPKKEDFIHVYGPMGAKWTWIARAKAVGLNTAEEAAKEFQVMRAKPECSCLTVAAVAEYAKTKSQPEKK
jgi:hypothetical protein